MVQGEFIEHIPFVPVVVAWDQAVQSAHVILDTGFSGDLQVTPAMAKELNLEVIGVTRTQIANGQTIEVPVALAIVAMEGISHAVEVLISDSMPLGGISFLSKFSYKAIVDCKNKTVVLEQAH